MQNKTVKILLVINIFIGISFATILVLQSIGVLNIAQTSQMVTLFTCAVATVLVLLAIIVFLIVILLRKSKNEPLMNVDEQEAHESLRAQDVQTCPVPVKSNQAQEANTVLATDATKEFDENSLLQGLSTYMSQSEELGMPDAHEVRCVTNNVALNPRPFCVENAEKKVFDTDFTSQDILFTGAQVNDELNLDNEFISKPNQIQYATGSSQNSAKKTSIKNNDNIIPGKEARILEVISEIINIINENEGK